MKYLTPNQVYKKYGYHPKTLAEWAKFGKIELIKSPGGHRRYPESAFQKSSNIDNREVILYARVSTRSQKDDLENQIAFLGKHYPNTRLVKDIASGMNWKRKQFVKLMERVAKGEIKTIVVAHKDRLCRFGFEFVEWFCNLNEWEIVVINSTKLSPHEELMSERMSIMHCFSSRLYFLRAYEKKLEQEYKNSNKS